MKSDFDVRVKCRVLSNKLLSVIVSVVAPIISTSDWQNPVTGICRESGS